MKSGDSPTTDPEAHHIIASWASSEGVPIRSSDVTNAYFQAAPATRLLMAQPPGGVPDPDVPDDACFICRVRVIMLLKGSIFWLGKRKDLRVGIA